MDNDKRRPTLSERLMQYDPSREVTATDRQWLNIEPMGREFGSPDYETLSCEDAKRVNHVFPGEILKKEFMDPQGVSAEQISAAVDLPLDSLAKILDGTEKITDDVAARLGRFFQMESAFWMNLQRASDEAKGDAQQRANL